MNIREETIEKFSAFLRENQTTTTGLLVIIECVVRELSARQTVSKESLRDITLWLESVNRM